jgi:hypothetical protein
MEETQSDGSLGSIRVCLACGGAFISPSGIAAYYCSDPKCTIQKIREHLAKNVVLRSPEDRRRPEVRTTRKELPRPVSIHVRKLRTLNKLERDKYPEVYSGYWRPIIREDCRGVERPCPFVGCRHNLYLDVNRTGALKMNFPHLEPWEMPPDKSCALDIAEEEGEITFDHLGLLMNMCKERISQYVEKVVGILKGTELEDHVG